MIVILKYEHFKRSFLLINVGTKILLALFILQNFSKILSSLKTRGVICSLKKYTPFILEDFILFSKQMSL